MKATFGEQYRNCVTTNPRKVSGAWRTLGRQNIGPQISSYPSIIHKSFITVLQREGQQTVVKILAERQEASEQ